MKNASKMFDWSLNALTVLCIVLVLSVFIQRHFFSSADPEARNVVLQKGTQISLPEVRWSDNPTNLVMALAVGCHYCQESAQFYRNLIAANANNAFRPIAVLPQEVSESRLYFQTEGIRIVDVRKSDLGHLGISGTPTLILVNGSGLVESIWVGKLSSEQEKEVYISLGIHPSSTTKIPAADQGSQSFAALLSETPTNSVTPAELFLLLRGKAVIPIVDTRSRSDYANGHIAGSINIPTDELEMRAVHEIPSDSRVIMYCNIPLTCRFGNSAHNTAMHCSNEISLMRDLGFANARPLSADLAQLKAAGVPVVDHVITEPTKQPSGSF